MKRVLTYAFLILILLSSSSLTVNARARIQVPPIKEGSPSTFGEIGNSFVNWPQFWGLFNQYSAWDLEYNTGPGWISDKSQLEVYKNYTNQEGLPRPKNESSRVKITLNFTAQYNADYRLTFGIDVKIKNYLHVQGQYNYSIEYQDYTCFFDWTDIKDVPTLIITHGVKLIDGENYFWFRIRKNNVSVDQNFVLDPTFGETGTGDTDGPVGFANYWKMGSKFTLTEDGQVQNISLYIADDPDDGQGVTCAIYDIDGSDNPDNLLGETNEIDGASITSGTWVTFLGNDFPLDLTADDYVIALCSDSNGQWKIRYELTSTSYYDRANDNPPASDPWGSHAKISGDHICIYATYTVAAGVAYVVDLSLSINETQTKSEVMSFNVNPTYGPNISYVKDHITNFGVYPGLTLDYTFTKSVDAFFNVVSTLSITHNYLLEVIHTISGAVNYVVDLSLNVGVNLTLDILTGLQYFVSSALSMSPQFSVESIPAVSEYELFNELLFGNGAWLGLLIILCICFFVTHFVKYSSLGFSVALIFIGISYLNNASDNTLVYMALICWAMIPLLLFIEARRLKKGE